MRIHPLDAPLKGEVRIPGDKSVTHRAVMLASIAQGDSLITDPGDGEDNVRTVEVMKQLGVEAEITDEGIRVKGVGLHGLRNPTESLDCGNSGTTARLLVGLLAGAGIEAELIGDASLSSRPMARVADPLRDLGYVVETTGDRHTLPMRTSAKRAAEENAQGTRAILKIASAQVKSCILLSGLYRNHDTQVVEPAVSRDHTERLLRAMGARVESTAHYMAPVNHAESQTLPTSQLYPGLALRGGKLEVPGDFSSAAFLIAAAIVAGERVTLRNVNTNPTRIGMLHVLERMNADISLENRRVLTTGEPVADIVVKPSKLQGTVVQGAEIPLLIDEIPVLCVLGALADGPFEIRDAKELRVKESDRVETTAEILEGMDVKVERREDGLLVHGTGKSGWNGFEIDAQHDHRVAMTAAVAGLGCVSDVKIHGAECIDISYPAFADHLISLGAKISKERNA